MSSLEVAFLLGVIVAVALGVGWWLSSTFLASKQEFSQVYPVSAYVDADGDFLLCTTLGRTSSMGGGFFL
jgi:hypothetical protein